MKYNRLGSSDLNVSEICLGTMTWGEQNSEKEAHEQLHYAVSRGINFIDAAEMYPVPPKAETQGRTESYLGTWLRKQQRDKVIVATKITAPGRGFNWVRGGPEAVDRKSIQEALNGSLRRLQTDYVDLYQIHWPDRYLPLFGNVFYDPKRNARLYLSKISSRPSPSSSRPARSVTSDCPTSHLGAHWSSSVSRGRRGCRWWPRPRTPTICSTVLMKPVCRK